MLREFFFSPKWDTLVWSWSGLVLIVGHALLRAHVKKLMNDWVGRFYDLGGSAGEVGSGDTEELQEGAQKVTRLLAEFAIICVPGVLITPIFKLVTNRWVLSWRLALIKEYLKKWNDDTVKMENGAQRIHEDTARFARGLQTSAVVLLDSVLTVAVFAPVLIQLGYDIQPRELPSYWMLLLCIGVASVGLVVSMLLGWSLIALEVNNQRVEADLRKALVLREETDMVEASVPYLERNKAFTDGPINEIKAQFESIITDLKAKYVKLYYRFAAFNVWLVTYEQSVVILPYLLTGPLLYSSTSRVTLGTVTKVSHSFSNVFDALNILSDRWVEVTDFLSVMRRLREFESQALSGSTTRPSLVVSVEMTSSEDTKNNVAC